MPMSETTWFYNFDDPTSMMRFRVKTPREGGLNVLMVGAGFSKSFNRNSLLWSELLSKVARALGEPAPPNPSDNYVEALKISRQHSKRRRDARATQFQVTVAEQIKKCWPENWEQGCQDSQKDNFVRFLDAMRCDVIIDLNYDPCTETLLKEKNIPHTILTGSEIQWTGTVPSGALILWKIHGRMSVPETIVFSPTEYQRVYETNALGADLEILGQRTENLFTVGVGLTDDDVWAYLCSPIEGPKSITALWTDNKNVEEKTELSLHRWHKAVSPRSVSVLHAPWDNDNRVTLDNRLENLSKEIEGATTTSPRTNKPLRSHFSSRIAQINSDYQKALSLGYEHEETALRVAASGRTEFEALRTFLISFGPERLAQTWCHEVPTNFDEVPGKYEDLAKSIRSVCVRASEFCVDQSSGIVEIAAAQAAVAYMVELAELLGLGVSVRLEEVPSNLYLGEGQPIRIGSNPFFIRKPGAENPMQWFVPSAVLEVGFPLLGQVSNSKQESACDAMNQAPICPAEEPERVLLSEDEWEACVVHVYSQRKPTLILNWGDNKEEKVDIVSVPPLYPWGFRLLDAGSYRRQSGGTVSVKWHLVRKFLSGGGQVCKGGGLRDRGRRAFRIGGRGVVRIGESDAFLEPAYHNPHP